MTIQAQLRDSDNGAQSRGPLSIDMRSRIDGRYAIKRLLASGGIADVYAAEHCYTRRAVALKLPRAAGPQEKARLMREMDALARVRGPGIVELWDGGEFNGVPYLVFELLEGRTVEGLITARGRLGVGESVRIALETARALERCHAAGVVHRDVKPANLFVTPGAEPQTRLLDFGIAKLAGDAGDVHDPALGGKLTREHALLGTPEYMAPEALLAQGELDGRADVYGVGVVLYECLTGTVPFEGTYAEVLLKISTTTPKPIQELRPDVPADLAGVVTRALARAAAERFASMTELVAALESAVPKLPRIDLFGRVTAPPAVGAPSPTRTMADSPTALQQSAPVDWRSRRKQPRAPYITLARLTRPNGERVDGRLEEVSEGGLQFVGDSAIPLGEAVKVRFALPATGQMTEVTATARWNRTVRGSNATGVQFDEISEVARQEIGKYVAIVSPPD
ncbi:MAG: protein kinase [Myxococcales bacterium]|nr:protein kinase [Myxococcales bacterium]